MGASTHQQPGAGVALPNGAGLRRGTVQRGGQQAAGGARHDKTVSKWRRRFAARRLEGLADEPRPGVPRSITDAQVEQVITKTLEEQPADATHWSTRSMARASGMSQTAISRIWRAFGLKPHLVQTSKLSSDPQFIDKVRDIVGLYLNPPETVVVLWVDQRSQIQALERTAPILPLMPGSPQRRSHDYTRHGTTNLYAALNLSSTHKTPAIRRWLLRHPRFLVHFTPTYSSWLNLVEWWFAELTSTWLCRGTYRSVGELTASIQSWIDTWNQHPRPFVWTKTAL